MLVHECLSLGDNKSRHTHREFAHCVVSILFKVNRKVKRLYPGSNKTSWENQVATTTSTSTDSLLVYYMQKRRSERITLLTLCLLSVKVLSILSKSQYK